MSMDTSHRSQLILGYEGQLMATAMYGGVSNVLDHAYAVCDAGVNVLMRVEGAEAASLFALALADRVVGRHLAATALPAVKPPPAVVDEPALQQTADPPRPPLFVAAAIFMAGAFAGIAMLSSILNMRL